VTVANISPHQAPVSLSANKPLPYKIIKQFAIDSKKSCIFAALFFANKDNLKSNTYGS
jgi:hypothetical protein